MIKLIYVSSEKETDNFCNDALLALMQFFVLCRLIIRSTEKILDFKSNLERLKCIDNDVLGTKKFIS